MPHSNTPRKLRRILPVKRVPPKARSQHGRGSTTRQLIDNASAAMFVFQGKKNVYANAAAEQLTGYNRQALLRMAFWEIIHPDFKMMVQQRGNARQRGIKIPTRYEVKIVRSDGGERWLDYSGATIVWHGKTAVLGTAIDITDKKNAERELRRRLNQLEALHETILATSANLDLNSVLPVLLEKIDAFLGLPLLAVIRVRDRQTGEPQAMALRNISEEIWLKFVPRGGLGLTRAVLESKSLVVVSDAPKDLRLYRPEFFRQLGVASYLGLPLCLGNEVIGDIGLFTKVRHEFTEDEIEFISTLTNQAAIAVHNAQLYEEIKRRSEAAAALNDIAQATSKSLDLNVVLREAVHAIAKIARFDGARIYLFDEVAADAHLQAAFDNQSGPWSLVKTVARGVGIIGKVAESGEPAIFEDVRDDPRYAHMSYTEGAKNAEGRFFGVFPIQTKFKSWGALSCMAKIPRRLNDEDRELIVSMCNQVAVAIENASLYQGSADRANELTTLYSVVADCMRFLDINTLLYQTMRKLLDIFAFDAARIYLREANNGRLKLAVQEGFERSLALPEHYEEGQGLIGVVAQKGDCLVVEDMQDDDNYLRLAVTKTLLQGGYRGSFFIPIKAREGIIGVMNFVSKNPHPFSRADIERFNAIAYHLGVAVGTARLFSQLTQRTRELEKANKAKDEFLSVVSHELRTPLNVILGYTDYLTGELSDQSLPQISTALAKVGAHAKSLNAKVESILTTTTIEAGIARAIPSEFNLGDWFTQLRSGYEKPMFSELKLEWQAPETDAIITTDHMKLRQIITNLIDNAIKFTDRGTVTVSARLLGATGKVRFTVKDTGIGISAQDVSCIFDMFNQVDNSSTRAYEGVGLGLYIVKKLSELLHGEVAVESTPGKGSTFTVEIPLSLSAEIQ